MKEPTAKQTALAEWVAKFCEEKGYCPTFREAAAAFSVSLSAITSQALALKSKGVLTWEQNDSRTLRPVKK